MPAWYKEVQANHRWRYFQIIWCSAAAQQRGPLTGPPNLYIVQQLSQQGLLALIPGLWPVSVLTDEIFTEHPRALVHM